MLSIIFYVKMGDAEIYFSDPPQRAAHQKEIACVLKRSDDKTRRRSDVPSMTTRISTADRAYQPSRRDT